MPISINFTLFIHENIIFMEYFHRELIKRTHKVDFIKKEAINRFIVPLIFNKLFYISIK